MIRPARSDDVPAILALIRELAEYEHEPDAVQATEHSLSAALFTEQPKAFCHVVERDGELVGMALWFVNFSTWLGRHGIYLEDLYVRPEHRGAGHGRALLAALAAVAIERGYGRLEWWVLDWNEGAHRFYESLGARPMNEWTVWRLTGEPLGDLAATAR